MKEIYVDNCSISISLEPDYDIKSADNIQYDKIIILDKKYNKTICIKIEKDDCIKKVAVIVPYFIYIDNCALSAKQYIFFMFDNLWCLFDPRTMNFVKQKNVLTVEGTMFAAYPYKEDFILYGEIEIYRVTQDLSIKWSFSGKDIFVRYKGEEPAFEMKEDRICLYDFMDNYYEINFDGILINSKFVSKE